MGLWDRFKSIFVTEKPRGGEIFRREAAHARAVHAEVEQKIVEKKKVLERDLRQIIKEAYEQGYDFVLLLEDFIQKMEKSGTPYNVDVWKEKLQSQVFKRLNSYFLLLAQLKSKEKKEAPLSLGEPTRDLQKYELYRGTLMAERPAQFVESALRFLKAVLLAVKIRQENLIRGVAAIEKIKQLREAA